MSEALVTFLKARLDDETELARRCDGDGCGRWSAHGNTVDFCEVEISGFPPAITLHLALHDPEPLIGGSVVSMPILDGDVAAAPSPARQASSPDSANNWPPHRRHLGPTDSPYHTKDR
ncbi:hypothetical protein ACFWHQ_08815 [Streptomyces sp. NPDC060334]|uniref:hypothetical protein n=1 Tax=Streptomyces sp. NPDC060334 TaxID=3347099 RepID=UPI0036686B2A